MMNTNLDYENIPGTKGRKGLFWYFLAIVSILGLCFCVPLLFPGVREIAIHLAERFVFHRELENRHVVAAREALAIFAVFWVCFIIFLDFWALTGPGKTILEKTGFIDIHEKEILGAGASLVKRIAAEPFKIFGLAAGFFVLMVALSRAANTGMTRDEATMCLDVVFTGIPEALMRSQYLNNHMLDALLIRITLLVTQTRFNEFFIRLPSLVFYGVYLLFAYQIAKQRKHPYVVFLLFVTNYYLNEFSGLARGYGMAAACMLGAFYFFNSWKTDRENKRLFHYCMIWCALAALANGITLYTTFCLLMVVMVKYRRNIIKLSNLPYFLVFFFVAFYLVFVSRPTMPGKPIATTRRLYDSVVAAVFDTFSLSNQHVAIALFIIFVCTVAWLMIKTKGKNDYGWIYIIFIGISLLSNVLLGRGYPLSREMIPFYPVIVLAAADVLEYIKPNRITRLPFALAALLLCFQFVVQINTRETKDWKEDYRRRNEILSFIRTERIEAGGDDKVKESLRKYIETEPSSVGMFYLQKLSVILDK
jgi:hypothetical protein